MDIDDKNLMIYDIRKKSATATFAIWMSPLGYLGGYWFYLRNFPIAIAQLALNLVAFSLIVASFAVIAAEFAQPITDSISLLREYSSSNITTQMFSDMLTAIWDNFMLMPAITVISLFIAGIAVFGLGRLWWILDAFLLHGIIAKRNTQIAEGILKNNSV